MQEEIAAASFILPSAPLYIVAAILVAITAMVSSRIRDKDDILPSFYINALALFLYLGSWISMIHIFMSMSVLNDIVALSAVSRIEMILHSVILNIIFIALFIWYLTVVVVRN